MPPLNKYLNVSGIKSSEEQQDKGHLKTCTIDKNDKKLEENGLDGCNKMVREGNTNKYLHKKFKKVATLEETSPGKAKGVLYPIPQDNEDPGSPRGNGRYVCPYCKLSCAKPSVLEKHIRAHTNERPYPCLPCGFAFKTKSNLYKHCRSRTHTLKMDSQSSEEEESQQEVKRIYKPKFHLAGESKPMEIHHQAVGSPSPEVMQMRINKLIIENQAIINDPIWPKNNSPSPLRNGDSRSPFSFKSATPERDEAQPLNLTVKEPRKRSLSETMISKGGSIIKDILLKTREKPDLTKMADAILHPCPNCKVVFRTLENLNTHLYSCKPKSSPGPLLGKTPLVDSFKDLRKRKLDFSLNLDDNIKKTIKLFGGEVQILDNPTGESKTLRIDGRRDYSEKKEVLTISKTGLHSVGGTMTQSESVSPKPMYQDKMVLPILPTVAPPNVPGIASPLRFPPNINPLTSITCFNQLTLPTSTLTPMKSKSPNPNPYNGVVTIFHAGKQIPYVQGMPGPNSLQPSQPLIRKKHEKSVIIKPTLQNIDTKTMLPLRIETEGKLSPVDQSETNLETAEKKFLRPNSLPLKPGTYTPKKSLTTPIVMPLVSPETPRPKKSYGQFYLNGHAYTYLGMKISTKPFFCTKQPQPIYVPLSPDQYPHVSMYSYWEIIKDQSPTPPGLDTRKAMSYYDSRNKDSSYVTSNRNRQDLMTHSSYFVNREAKTEVEPVLDSLKKEDENEPNPKRIKICEGGFESNEDYIYVRGRAHSFSGRGRYVCEECGIRCKKPSMLKKHIRTHTDLRPYTCKYCAFSFKTKGNLTKHMKSKTHFKKCKELDISPLPNPGYDHPEDPDSTVDDGELMGGDDESEDESDDEDEDDDEDDSGDEGEDCRIEREAAKSLLSLSVVALESEHRQHVNAGLVAQSARPLSFPYASTRDKMDEKANIQPWVNDLLIMTKDCPDFRVEEVQSGPSSDSALSSPSSMSSISSSRPMDLSNKPIIGCAKTSVITSVSGPLASIPSNIENIPPSTPTPTTEYPEDSVLLHAYLTERAVRDLKIKQQQMSDSQSPERESPKEEKVAESKCLPTTPTVPVVSRIEMTERIIRMPTPPVESPTKSPPRKMLENPNKQLKAEFFPPSSTPNLSYISTTEDGRSMCVMCNKVFNKPSQLRLHVNIHYFERPFRCEPCAVSFRTKGHLQKHERSLNHLNKVNMNSTFGTATTSNPRPFKCTDCKVAFRIHGHLAKHFRSKMHIMKLECIGKLPFGTYADLEKFGVNMNDIDTTDCENSLESLQLLAAKMADMATKVSTKLTWSDSSDCSTKCSDDEGGSGARVTPPKNPSSPPLPPAPCFQKEVKF